MSRKPELWGAAEIANHLGVTPSLVHRWIRAGRLPAPIAELRMGKVWDAEEIREWNRSRVAKHRRRGVI